MPRLRFVAKQFEAHVQSLDDAPDAVDGLLVERDDEMLGDVKLAILENLIAFEACLSFYLKVERIVEPKPTFLAFPLHRGVRGSFRGLKIG